MLNSILLSVSADSTFYEKWSDILTNKGIFNDGLRIFLWGLAKVFAWICDACEKLLIMANKAIGFIYSDKVVEFISQWRFIIIGILIIAVLFFGINMIVNKKQDRSKLLQNFAIAACVLIGLSSFIPTLGKNTANWSKSLISSNSSSSAEIIKGAVIDLYYLDANNFSNSAAKTKNKISSKRIMNIDPTEAITSSDDVSNPKVFSYRLSYDKDGKPVLDEIDDSGFSWNNDPYYRYSIDFTTIYITLFATAIVMIFTAFKVVKIVFDIIVHQILAVVLAAGDWASGQKLKEVIKSLFALFFSVFMCSVMMKLYFLFSAWTSSNIDSGVARALLLVFAAFAVIDGPNIVEKIFGIDAGLASTFRSVSTLFFATSGMTRLTHGLTHGASSLVRGAAHGAGGAGGFFKGLTNSIKNAESSVSDNKQSIADSVANQNSKSISSDNSSSNSKNSNAHTASNANQNKEDNLNLKGSNNTSEQNASSADNTNENNENSKTIANAAADNLSSDKSPGIADSSVQDGRRNTSNIPDTVDTNDKHSNPIANEASEKTSSGNNPNLSDSVQKNNTRSYPTVSENQRNDKFNSNNNPSSADNPFGESKAAEQDNILGQQSSPINSSNEGNTDKNSIANASAEPLKADNKPVMPEVTGKKENSISNSANNGTPKSNFDYLDNKARNPRSVLGAGVRGYKGGHYVGEKIGNAATKIAKKHNLKGDEK